MYRSRNINQGKAVKALSCLVLLAGLLPAQSSGNRGPVNVTSYGAAGDGVSDDTAAIQSALNAAAAGQNATYFPCGVYAVTQTLEVSSPVQMDDCATIRALLPMGAVINIGSAAPVADGSFRGGIVDANNLAQDGLFLRAYAGFRIVDTEVLNAQANGFHLADPSLQGPSAEATLEAVHTRRTAGTLNAGSAGLLIEANAIATKVARSVFVGSDIGIKTLSGGNIFTDIHVWSPSSAGPMTVGFDDYGSGNLWKGCEPDTAQVYGLHAHQSNTIIEGCRFYNGPFGGKNGVAIGVLFDLPQPNATLSGNLFIGQDSSHQFAQDVAVETASAVAVSGNHVVNVAHHLLNP